VEADGVGVGVHDDWRRSFWDRGKGGWLAVIAGAIAN
jgi:hypothetical protein